MHTVGAVFVHWLALLLVIHNMLCHVSLYSCPQGCRISVSRRSQDPLRPRSRLGLIGKRLGLGIKGLGLGIGLGQLGLVHKSFFAGMLYFLFIQNAIMWPQPLVLFAQLDSLPCRRPLHYRPTVFIQQTHSLKSIDLQANIVIILFVYYQLIRTTFINIRRRKIRHNKTV